MFAGHTVTGVYSLSAHPSLFLWAVEIAYEGVAIFFLISGFLLYRPFLVARREGRPFRSAPTRSGGCCGSSRRTGSR